MPPPPSNPPPTLLFHSLPSNVFQGLDLLSSTITPNFHGIKNLTAGYHFLYSAPNASLSIRHGRWFYVKPSAGASADGDAVDAQIFVWRWDNEEECLIPEANKDVARRVRGALATEWERSLLDYRGDRGAGSAMQIGGWRELTSYITGELLDRVLGCPADAETVGAGWTITTVSSGPLDTEKIPGLTFSESAIKGEKELNFVGVDLKKTWPEGAVGRQRTDGARDRSWYLGHLIEQAAEEVGGDKKVGAAQLLGELQLCFLMVLTLANWSCFEQWKRILGVLLSCRLAVSEVEDYFVEVTRVLWLQLRHCEDVEGGLFDLREEGAGWLRALLSQFRAGVEEVFEAGAGQRLKTELSKVEEYLEDEFGWDRRKNMVRRGVLELEDGEMVQMDMNGADEEEEKGEYAPVIVDLGG